MNVHGTSKLSVEISTDDFYGEFPSRSLPADVHGILTRGAPLGGHLGRQGGRMAG